MLTQKKRKRTVEDFNQFCTFVLAYAGYIPYPSEEWWCNSNTPKDNATCSPIHSSGTLPQSKKGSGGKDKAKKRKLDKKSSTSPGDAKAKRRSADGAVSATKKSPKSKKAGKSPSSSSPLSSQAPPLPQWPSTSLFPNSATTMPGACRITTENDGVPLPSTAPMSGASSPYGGPTFGSSSSTPVKDEREEMESRVGVGLNSDDIKRGSTRQEVKEEEGEELANATQVSNTGSSSSNCMEKVIKIESRVPETSQQRGGEGSQGEASSSREEESDGWEEGSSEAGSGSGGTTTDILQLLIERRLGRRLPEDQETGYHTDSTPDRATSDNEQDTRAGDGNTTASSACGTEDSSMDHGKEEDDSWDLITCFCMKPFAGRPMIECNECGTWVHLSCAKIRRTHVPDIFVCQPCRDAKQNIRRSNRARTVPRKRFSD